MRLQSGYNRDKNEYEFTPFTLDNYQNYGHCSAIDQYGKVRNVKITTIKTWKRTPNIEIHWKYGLREFGTSLLTPDGFRDGDVILGNAVMVENQS